VLNFKTADLGPLSDELHLKPRRTAKRGPNPFNKFKMDKSNFQGTRVAQSVKRPTHDLNLGVDLRVVSSSPTLGMKHTLKKKK